MTTKAIEKKLNQIADDEFYTINEVTNLGVMFWCGGYTSVRRELLQNAARVQMFKTSKGGHWRITGKSLKKYVRDKARRIYRQ